jgi:hypothetical protein
MLASAREIASDPHAQSDPESLLSVASDLVEWGAYGEAGQVLARLDELGAFRKEVGLLRGKIDLFSKLGPEFHDQLLADALTSVARHDAPPGDLAKAADSFLKWGALDEAEAAIARFEHVPALRGQAATMRAAARQLRRSGILSIFSPIGSAATANLNRPHEATLARNERAGGRLLVAFTGADRKFWMSLHVLYHFLSRFDVHVLYLHDHSATMFLNGLTSVAPGYESMLDLIRGVMADVSARQVFVMGFSAGGFTALRASADLAADSYLGFGIRTDVSDHSPLPRSDYVDAARRHCRDADAFIDLRPYLAARDRPRRIRLIAGQGAKHDVAHAEHLRGLANVEIAYLTNYNHHNVMPGLIARGLLPEVLGDFFGPAKSGNDG